MHTTNHTPTRGRGTSRRRALSFLLLLLPVATLLWTGCAFGNSAMAGYQRGLFAGQAASDLNVAATEIDSLIEELRARDELARRRALEAEFAEAVDTLAAAGQLTPDRVRAIYRGYGDASARLNADLLQDKITVGSAVAKVRAGATDIRTLLEAQDMERAAQAEVQRFIVEEALPEAATTVATEAAAAAARKQADADRERALAAAHAAAGEHHAPAEPAAPAEGADPAARRR